MTEKEMLVYELNSEIREISGEINRTLEVMQNWVDNIQRNINETRNRVEEIDKKRAEVSRLLFAKEDK